MDTTTSKPALLERLRSERAAWEALLAELGEQRMQQAGTLAAWSFADLVAHLTTWWRREIAFLEAARRGEQPEAHPPQADVLIINRWVQLTNRDRPLSDLLRDASAAWEQLETSIDATDEADLVQAGRFAWLAGGALGTTVVDNFVGHWHDEHEPAVRAWLRGSHPSGYIIP